MPLYDTIILAGGEGSRMKELTQEKGVPKHLLPLGDETPVSRLVRQLGPYSERIFCVVNEGQREVFENHISGAEIVEKKAGGIPFISDLEAVADSISRNVIVVTGDLIFSDKEVEIALQTLKKYQIITDWKDIKTGKGIPLRFIVIPKEILLKFNREKVNPESAKSMILFLFKNLILEILSGKVGIKSIATISNLNTPKDYYRAIETL